MLVFQDREVGLYLTDRLLTRSARLSGVIRGWVVLIRSQVTTLVTSVLIGETSPKDGPLA
jgi:hypothetical protein